MRRCFILLPYLLSVITAPKLLAQGLEIGGCAVLSNSRPGYGEAYRGRVANSDYGFSAQIPSGMTGWGAGPGAPFHGFTVFLHPNPPLESCLNLAVDQIFDPPIQETTPISNHAGATVKIGNRLGSETISHGAINGIEYENIVIRIELVRSGNKFALALTLVTPMSVAKQTRPVFERFAASFDFR